MKARAVFSWVIKRSVEDDPVGYEIKKFNNASIAVSFDGMGTAGIASVGFSFSVPVSAYPNYGVIFEGGAQVSVHGYTGTGGQSFQSQTFYVSSKSSDGNIVSIKCYDRMTYAEADFPCTEEEFYDHDGNEVGMPAALVMNRICAEMGLTLQLNDDGLSEFLTDFVIPKSLLFGKTCRDVLNTFAQALCGVWCCRGTRLLFVPFGADITDFAEIQASAVYHENLKNTSRILLDSCFMTDNTNSYGQQITGSGTVNINTPLACPGLYTAVANRVKTLYTGYSCGNAYINALPAFPMSCAFKEDNPNGVPPPRPVNYCSVKLTKKGALASLGMNRIDEGEWVYKNRTRRELDSRYKDGDLWGNTEITKKDGIKHVYVNENGSKEKYGYETREEGITVYDGDMIDKIPAEDLTPEFDDDDNAKTVTYFKDGVKTVLEFEWDGDNIKSYKRKKYKVDPDTGEETLVFEDNTV